MKGASSTQYIGGIVSDQSSNMSAKIMLYFSKRVKTFRATGTLKTDVHTSFSLFEELHQQGNYFLYVKVEP